MAKEIPNPVSIGIGDKKMVNDLDVGVTYSKGGCRQPVTFMNGKIV